MFQAHVAPLILAASKVCLKSRRMVSNSRGSAPWNEKIDCLSSPTAKIDRRNMPRAPAPAANSDDELRDDVPLLGACVLRLVDQQVIDAKVELVMHPGRAHAGEQVAGLGDQVVIVEEAARFLLGAIARDDFGGERQQGAGTRTNDDGAPAIEQRTEALLLFEQRLHSAGMLVANALGDHVFARRAAVRCRTARSARRGVRLRSPLRGFGRRAACSRSVLVPLAGSSTTAGHSDIETCGASKISRRCSQLCRSDRSRAPATVPPWLLRCRWPIDPFGDLAMLTDGLSQSQLERKIARQRMISASARPAGAVGAGGGCKQDLHPDVFQHLLLLRLFQHLEARRDVGLERKLLQQPRAEGVDGLHLQAAGRLQRLGEQLARPRASFGVDLLDAGRADFLCRALRRRAWSSAPAARTRGSPCWRRPPWYR